MIKNYVGAVDLKPRKIPNHCKPKFLLHKTNKYSKQKSYGMDNN